MLNRIKLSYFRRHIETEVVLHNGLMVLRGANESGKSTLLEAVAYALGSVKFLREALEDVVTYYKENGVITHREPVSKLKVELDLTIDGVQYFVKRSKAGAEVNYDGGRVTGQGEVTAFLFKKMGVDPAIASRLMFANQGEIRGALAAKDSKVAVQLIEHLAEFDHIDLLLERMQEKLTLGATTQVEADLQRAQATCSKLVEVATPDFTALENAAVQAATAVTNATQASVKAEETLTQARAQLDLGRQRENTFTSTESALLGARERLARNTRDLDAAKLVADKQYVGRLEADIAKDIDDLTNANQTLQIHSRLAKYLEAPSESVEGMDLPTLLEAIADQAAQHDEAALAVNQAQRTIDLAQAAIATGSCSFCGQDFSELPAVAEKNAKHQAAIEQAKQDKAAAEVLVESTSAEGRRLQALQVATRDRLNALETHPDHLKRVGDSLPPVLAWKGPVIDSLQGSDQRLVAVRQELAKLRDFDRDSQNAKARVEALQDQRKAVESEIEKAEQDLAAAGAARMDIAHLTTVVNQARDAQSASQRQVSEAQIAKQQAEYDLRDAQRAFKQAAIDRQEAEDRIARLTDQLTTTQFNNTLLKRVRQCRPVIADKLWTIVLSTVSSYFSELRGERSRVTKDNDGFKVDGASIGGLSGSALDILGLAIRVALVRTFLPNAPFMVLDEPCAAMDTTRTEATLGFIVSCGFQQVLLVTHEDTSETVADHLVQL